DLLEVVGARHAVGRFAHLLYGRHEQANEHGDDGDYHQQLNERKTGTAFLGSVRHGLFLHEKLTMKTFSWRGRRRRPGAYFRRNGSSLLGPFLISTWIWDRAASA